jgi:hypothetical protein
LYEYKLEAEMKYNKILCINQDILVNQTYSDCFLKNKEELQNEIDRIILKALVDNNERCDNYCNKIMKENYKNVKN